MAKKARVLKSLFRSQWVNGEFDQFLKNLRRRFFEMYGIELKAKTPLELENELIERGFIEIGEKDEPTR